MTLDKGYLDSPICIHAVSKCKCFCTLTLICLFVCRSMLYRCTFVNAPHSQKFKMLLWKKLLKPL